MKNRCTLTGHMVYSGEFNSTNSISNSISKQQSHVTLNALQLPLSISHTVFSH